MSNLDIFDSEDEFNKNYNLFRRLLNSAQLDRKTLFSTYISGKSKDYFVRILFSTIVTTDPKFVVGEPSKYLYEYFQKRLNEISLELFISHIVAHFHQTYNLLYYQNQIQEDFKMYSESFNLLLSDLEKFFINLGKHDEFEKALDWYLKFSNVEDQTQLSLSLYSAMIAKE